MTVTASKYALRENDLYETEEWAVFALIRELKALGLWREGTIWEPAAGNHAMVRPFYKEGAKTVITSDIQTYRRAHTYIFDFLTKEPTPEIGDDYDLISNPPYGRGNHLARRFAENALARCDGVVALLLTAKFDFGATRLHLFRDNPRFRAKIALVDRISWIGNDETGTEDHAWYIWGPAGAEPKRPDMLYQGNPAKRNKARPA